LFVKAKREQVMKNDKEYAAKETEKKNIANKTPVKTTTFCCSSSYFL